MKKYCRVQPGKKRDYNYFVKKTNKKSKGKHWKYQNVLTRDQSKGMKDWTNSVYSPGETVLLRLGEKRNKFRKNIRILEEKWLKK